MSTNQVQLFAHLWFNLLKNPERSVLDLEENELLLTSEWYAPLFFGALQYHAVESRNLLNMLATNTIEFVRNLAPNDITLTNIPITNNQIHIIQRNLSVRRDNLDCMLIALSFSLFFLDLHELPRITSALEIDILKAVKRQKRRFIDRVSINTYKSIFRKYLSNNAFVLEPLRRYFDIVITHTDLLRMAGGSREILRRQIQVGIQLMVAEASSQIEVPEKLLYTVGNLNLISQVVDILYDENLSEKGHTSCSSPMYQWAFPRDGVLDNVNSFWIICLISLFALSEAIERALTPNDKQHNPIPYSTKEAKNACEDNGDANVPLSNSLLNSRKVSNHGKTCA